MPINKKLQDLGDQILAQLDRLPSNDGKTLQVRSHIYALIQALGGTPSSTTVPPPQRSVAPASVRLGVNQVPGDMAITDRPPSRPASAPAKPISTRPGLFTERRATRQAAGVTLKQVATAAGTTLPTARTYEIKRTAVRPDKRQALDAVYEQFKR